MERLKPKYIALTCYYRHKPGGLCKRLTRTMSALVERGAEVHYISATEFPISHPDCHFHRFHWIGENYDSPFFWTFFLFLTPFYAFYLTLRFRINRLFVFEPTYAFLLQPIRMIYQRALIVFFRADSIENYRIKKRHPALIQIATWIEGIGLNKCSVYAVSNQCLSNVLSRHRNRSLANKGVLRNDIPSIDIISKGIAPKLPLQLTCAGVFEDRKNQAFLIRLLSNIPKGLFTLNLYGLGPKQHELESLTRELKLNEDVLFHGWKNINDILENSDLFLIPSLHEGAPNIALEAISSGLPLLASNIEEHREILPQEVTLALKEDIWIQRLISISQDPQEELATLSRSLAICKNKLTFNWDKNINDLITGDRSKCE